MFSYAGVGRTLTHNFSVRPLIPMCDSAPPRSKGESLHPIMPYKTESQTPRHILLEKAFSWAKAQLLGPSRPSNRVLVVIMILQPE